MTRKLKILQVLAELNQGEVERSTVQFARFLVQLGHESYVLSNGGSMQNILEKEGSRHITMPVHKKSLLSFKTIFKIRSLLLKEGFDVIHICSRKPAWLVFQAWKRLPLNKRPKLVTTFNDYYSMNTDSEIMTQGEALICISRSVKNFILANYPTARKKHLQVIPRGIESQKINHNYQPDSKWQKEWAKESHSFKDKFLIALPGRISSAKGHADFLEILYYLKQDGIPVHGLIIGSVHSKSEDYFFRMKNSIQKLGLMNDISILLNRKDLCEIMMVSDLVVSCSMKPEAFDRDILTALSLGVPVIGYSHGILKEQLKALYPYGIIEAHKKSSMRLKIREFYKLEGKPKPLKNDGFTIERAHRKCLSIYEKIAEKKAMITNLI